MTAATAALPSGITLEPIHDLASARDEWERLARCAGNVFGTWEWAEAWCRHMASDAELALAAVRHPDREAPIALLPLYLAREHPFRLLRFIGSGQSDELGPLCAPEDRTAAAAALREHVLRALDGDGIFLGERLAGDAGLGAALGATTLRRAASPVLSVGSRSFDDFLTSRSRNFRNQVGRRERRLQRLYRVSYRLTTQPDRLHDDMQTLIRLHGARWGRQPHAFIGARARFHMEFAERALERGWLRLWTLELDDRPVAAWYGLRFAGIESYYQAGRDPACDRLNVGFVLLCHTIRSAFEEGVEEYRFGLGDEPYKSRFSERDPGLETVALATGARGAIALAAIRAALRMPAPVRRLAWRVGSPV